MSDDATRRQAARAGVVLQLQYRSTGHLLVNYCTNLSRGGLFVPSSTPAPVGTRLTLEVAIPGQHTPPRIEAEVRWVRQMDAPEGPAGMGLAFDDVDNVLGERIDALVSSFAPLQVHIIGDHPAVRVYVAAQVRALVSCETHEHDTLPGVIEKVAGADLVVVDTNAEPNTAVAVLRALARLERPPPRVALCHGSVGDRRASLANLARVVSTPVDTAELRESVLDTLTQVHAFEKPR